MHRAIVRSWFAGQLQDVTFYRHVPAVRASGEETANFWPVLTVEGVDVQPLESSTLRNSKLATQYAQLYVLTTNGDQDVRRMDRCYVDGAECVIETVHRFGGHTELEAGALLPGTRGNVLVNQLVEA